jgi:four helix bundle protein
MRDSVLRFKSFDFAIRMVNLYKYLKNEHGEYILSQQLIRSGTSIGAIIREVKRSMQRVQGILFIN